MIDPEQIVSLYFQRRSKRQPMMDKRMQVLEQYNGETLVPMPELDQQTKPAVANLLGLGLDQFAQRIASVLPDIDYPSLRQGFKDWDDKARKSRLANLGWWTMNRMDLLAYKRARYLLAFACAPVTIHPVSSRRNPEKRKIPFWRIRSPLNTFPAIPTDELDIEPMDYIVCHEYPLRWLEENYPTQTAVLYKGRQSQVNRDMKFEGSSSTTTPRRRSSSRAGPKKEDRQMGDWQDGEAGSAGVVQLARVPEQSADLQHGGPRKNRAGQAGRSSCSTPCFHLFTSQAQDGGLRGISPCSAPSSPEQMGDVTPPTFPDQAARIVRAADGEAGRRRDRRENGMIQALNIQPGSQVPTAIDRLERAARLAGGIPAEFGGEAASNIRTGRRERRSWATPWTCRSRSTSRSSPRPTTPRTCER